MSEMMRRFRLVFAACAIVTVNSVAMGDEANGSGGVGSGRAVADHL